LGSIDYYCTTDSQCLSRNCQAAKCHESFGATAFGSSPELCKSTTSIDIGSSTATSTNAYPGQWVCTNEIPNSTRFKSGCLYSSGAALTSSTFTCTGFAAVTTLTKRLDNGPTNKDAFIFGNSTQYENTCLQSHPQYPIAMFKQGTNLYRLDTETQQVLCDNPEDKEEIMVYFACCNEECGCVDPTVVAGADNSVNIASGVSPSSSSSSSTYAAAVAGSIGVVVGGAVVGVIVAGGRTGVGKLHPAAAYAAYERTRGVRPCGVCRN
jgi:hypothetical protein